MKIYFNGKIVPLNGAKISVLDRGLLYGDGVFESLRTYNRRPFLLEDHLKRLLAGARKIRITPPYSLSALKAAVLKTIAANPFKECYLKIIITRGPARGHGLDFSNAAGKPTLIVLVEEQREPPVEIFTKGWKAVISSVRRTKIPTSAIKSLCYLDNALALAEAKKSGANEAFMLDEKGRVAEGSVSNIFLVKRGLIYTPSIAEPILQGITRRLVMKLAWKAGLRVVEKIVTINDLHHCDECFVTLSGTGIIPVTRLGSKKIGDGKCGPLTQKLIHFYRAETRMDAKSGR